MIKYEDENGNDQWKCMASPEEHARFESKKARARAGRPKGSKNKPRVESPDPKFRDQPREPKATGNGRKRRKK